MKTGAFKTAIKLAIFRIKGNTNRSIGNRGGSTSSLISCNNQLKLLKNAQPEAHIFVQKGSSFVALGLIPSSMRNIRRSTGMTKLPVVLSMLAILQSIDSVL